MQTAEDVAHDWNARDELIAAQPLLRARAMLDAAEEARVPDARDAILARVGLTLFCRFGAVESYDSMRRAGFPVERRRP